MTKYYVLLYTDICVTRDAPHLSDDWYVVGVFLQKSDAQENIKNKNQYRVFEMKGSEHIDDEAQKYLIGNTEVFCLIRYEVFHVVLMDILCVSNDVDEIEEKCQNDTPIMGMYNYQYTYFYNRFVLNQINYEAENIPLRKEKEELFEYALKKK